MNEERQMKISVSVLAVMAIAGSAAAQLHLPSSAATGIPISLEDSGVLRGVPSDVYDGIAGPYAAFAAAGGVLGADDYVTTTAGPDFLMAQFLFVGGVTNVGETIRVNFLDTDENLVNFFTVALPVGGSTSLWTITLGAGVGGIESTFAVPSAGFVSIETVDTATGRFWLTQTLPIIGTNDINVLGAPGTHNHAFAMREVPAPGAFALLTLGGALAARRRR
jgi:hypothetical protein